MCHVLWKIRDCFRALDKREYLVIIKDTVKILKFGTPQIIAIIVLKIEKFDVTLH